MEQIPRFRKSGNLLLCEVELFGANIPFSQATAIVAEDEDAHKVYAEFSDRSDRFRLGIVCFL